jgi:hypothetical protein
MSAPSPLAAYVSSDSTYSRHVKYRPCRNSWIIHARPRRSRIIHYYMETATNPNSGTTLQLLSRAAAGDAVGWYPLLRRYHERSQRTIAVRLDPRLQGRFDPSDVFQETYLDAFGGFQEHRRSKHAFLPGPSDLLMDQSNYWRPDCRSRHHVRQICR